MKACMFASDGSGKPVDGAIPGNMIETANAAREALIEMVAEADDALMEKFFDAGTLTQDELVAGLKRGVAAARIFPVVLTSATANIGMQPLLDAIVAYVPSPAERPLRARNADGDEVEIATTDGGPASAFVWKTVADPFAGRITLFRVLSGTLKADSTLHNAGRDTPERLGHLILLQGKTQTNVPGDQGGRHRRGRQAEGDADERRARRQGGGDERAGDQVPRAGHLVRDRAEEPRRRGEDQHRRCTGCRKRTRRSTTPAIRRPRSCCSPARGSRTSRSRSPS